MKCDDERTTKQIERSEECPACAHFKKAIELAFTALTIAESQEEAGFNDAAADLETLLKRLGSAIVFSWKSGARIGPRTCKTHYSTWSESARFRARQIEVAP